MSCCAVAILLYQGFSCQPYSGVSFESVEHIDVSQVSYHDSIGFLYKSNVYTDEWKAETQWRPVSLSYSFHIVRVLYFALSKELYTGSSHLKIRSKPLTFYLPFLTEKVTILFNIIPTVEMLYLVSYTPELE